MSTLLDNNTPMSYSLLATPTLRTFSFHSNHSNIEPEAQTQTVRIEK
jgi:hypothetical protein